MKPSALAAERPQRDERICFALLIYIYTLTAQPAQAEGPAPSYRGNQIVSWPTT